ncbi:MAG: hypothetical protein J7604_16770 [Sporocytophaga sp.]|uniref:hypothetical protein n=1 Tax=Sporocytophaga sp. TaxID=2231183 RepID=UPI001B2E9373|nr:hypothetical protein [Sporocytophaga sp.]MBO9701863.1 hypothetical protein [Sporocytophaga sp.]
MKNKNEFLKYTYSGLKKYICKTLFIAGVFLYTLSSCSERRSLKREELMALHDNEMARMHMIIDLKNELKQLKDSTINEDHKKEISFQIKRLEEADEAMMNWMRNYDEPSESTDEDVKGKYYDDQKNIMIKVKEKIENGLDSGQIILNKYKH